MDSRQKRNPLGQGFPGIRTLTVLEPRMLLDAAAAATATSAAEHFTPSAPETTDDAALMQALEAVAPSTAADDGNRREVYFVDAAISDTDTLIKGLPEGAEIHRLDADQDGIVQIAAALEGRENLDAVHILSHGGEGEIQLGNLRLDSLAMQERYQSQLASIGQALSRDGDILIYACDFGAGELGGLALTNLATLTGADIAASTNLSGAAALGGDWELEARTGAIEATTFEAPDFEHLLATPTISAPSSVSLGEDQRLALTGNNAISVNDPEGDTLTVTVWTSYASFAGFGNTAGLTDPQGSANSGNSSSFQMWRGPIANLNTFLSGLTVSPLSNYDGPDATLNIRVSDETTTTQHTVRLNITSQADAINDTVTTASNTALTFNPKQNDSSSYTTITSITSANHGSAVLNSNDTITYTPATHYSGSDSITYTATTIESGTNFRYWATNPVDSASFSGSYPSGFPSGTPNASGWIPAFTSSERINAIEYQSGDFDRSGSIEFSGVFHVETPGNYFFTVSADNAARLFIDGVPVLDAGYNNTQEQRTIAHHLTAGKHTYQIQYADSGINHRVGLTYSGADTLNAPLSVDFSRYWGSRISTETASVAINVIAQAPSGSDRTITLSEDTVYNFHATDFGFSDADGDTFQSLVITTLPSNGVLTYLDGRERHRVDNAGMVLTAAQAATLRFEADRNANGTPYTAFTFQVRDSGNASNGGQNTDPTPNTITLNIRALNDAPQLQHQATNLANGSFENGSTAWTGSGGVETNSATTFYAVAESSGAQVAEVENRASTTPSYIQQTITTVAGQTYSFSVDVHTRTTNNVNDRGTLSVFSASNTSNPITSSSFTAEDAWETVTLTFTATSDRTVIRITSNGSISGMRPLSSDSAGLLVDNVQVYQTSHAVTYIEDSAPVALVASRIQVADPDDQNLASATVTLTNPQVGDRLLIRGSSETRGAFNGISWELTDNRIIFTGESSLFNYQTALQLVGFSTSDAPVAGVRNVSIEVNDGNQNSAPITTSVTVVPANDAPVSQPIPTQTGHDAQTVSLDTSAYFSDPDGEATLTFSASGLPTGLSIDSDSGVISGTFAPDASTIDPFAITVIATDSGGLSSSRSFTWTVNNPAPIAADDALSTTENTDLSGSVLVDNSSGADADLDGDTLVVTAVGNSPLAVGNTVTGSNGGDFRINADGSYTFSPGSSFDDLADGATQVTHVSYTISDDEGGTATATVSVTVTGQNDAPLAVDDTFTTDEDTATTIAVLSNDEDIDGDSRTLTRINGESIVTGGTVAITGGKITLNADGTLTFVPSTDFNGQVSLEYTLADSHGATDTGMIRGTVIPLEDGPVAIDDVFTVTEDGTTTIAVLDSDSDADGDTLTITRINQTSITIGSSVTVEHGTVTLNADGSLGFTPTPDYHGPATFSYTISDGLGGTATAMVKGSVTPVEDSPVISNVSFITDEDSPVTIAVPAGERDVDGDPLAITMIGNHRIQVGESVAVTGGTVTLNANLSLMFTPSPDYNGTPSFTYTVSDDKGNTATATVTGTVSPINDAPIAVDGMFSTDEDTATSIDLRDRVSDIDSDTFISQINGENIAVGTSIIITEADVRVGSVLLNTDGTLTVTPAENYHGTLSFAYTLSDGMLTDTATLTVTVNPVNDTPVAIEDHYSTPEDTALVVALPHGLLDNDSDVDGDDLTARLVQGPTHGTLTLNADGTFLYTPAPNYHGPDAFSYRVTDGTAESDVVTAHITVEARNDAPVASSYAFTLGEDATASGNLPTATDPEGDTVVYAIGGTEPAHGRVTINSDGTYTYIPTPNYHGSDTFSYLVSDGLGGQNQYSVTVTVTPVNDVPEIIAELPGITHADGQLLNYDIAGYFIAIEVEDNLNFEITGLPTGLSYDPVTGVISGTIDKHASQGGTDGVYTITVTARDRSDRTDPEALSVSQTFDLTVVNPPPTALDFSFITEEDTPISVDVLEDVINPDGDPLIVTTTSAANGTVVIVDNMLSYTPNPNFNGTDTITYTISDGEGGISSSTVTINVTPVNDAPTADSIASQINSDSEANVHLDISSYFDDVDSDSLSYSATNLPPGLTIDPSTGLISGNLTSNASQGGLYNVSITATDGNGASVTQTLEWQVFDTVPSVGDDFLTVSENGRGTGEALSNDTDLDGDNLAVVSINGQLVSAGDIVTTVTGSNGGRFEITREGGYVFEPGSDFDDLRNGEQRITAVTYTVVSEDGTPSSNTGQITVTVTGVNDAPTVVSIPDVTLTDGQSIFASPVGFFEDAEDSALTFSQTGLPAGLEMAANGTITGVIASDASTHDGPYSVTITATDSQGASVSTTVNLTITNPAPTAVNDIISTSEDTAIDIDVLENDRDPDGDTLKIDPGFTPTANNGTVTLNAGMLHYVPDADFHGVDTIVYQITDGQGGVSTGRVTVTVNAVNDVPVLDLDVANGLAANHSLTFIEGQAPIEIADHDAIVVDVEDNIVALNVALAGFIDGSNERIHLNDTTSLVYGTVDTGTITVGSVSLVFHYDGADGLHFAHASGDTTPIPATVLSALIREIRYENTSQNPGIGTRTLSITATDGDNATSVPAVTRVTVEAVNDAPAAADDSATTAEDTVITADTASLLDNDTDPDNPRSSFSVTTLTDGTTTVAAGNALTGTSGGRFIINTNGTWSFDPNGEFENLQVGEQRLTSVTYTLADGSGVTDTATLSITVTGVNDLPVGSHVASGATTPEDTAKTGHLPPASDAENDTLAYHVTSQPTHGSVSVGNDGTYRYTPAPDYHGTDSFTYHINDGTGNSVSYTVTVEVTPANDAPVGSAIAAISYQDGQTIAPFDVAAHFSDVDDGDSLTYTQTGLPQGLSINPVTGQISGTLHGSASQDGNNGVYTAIITATDQGMLSTSQTVTITVTNPPPMAFSNSVTTDESSAISGTLLSQDGAGDRPGTATDTDGDILTVVAVNGIADNVSAVDASTPVSVSGSTGGSFIIHADGSYRFDPGTAFDGLQADERASTSVQYTISDGEGGLSMATVIVVVTGVNDAPVGANDRITLTEDMAHEANLPTATDVDGNHVTYAVANQPANGSVAINSDGSYRYTPSENFNGSDRFTYTISDGTATTTYSVDVIVQPVNDSPVSTLPSPFTAIEDTPLTLNGLRVEDIDAQSSNITIRLIVNAGTLSASVADSDNVIAEGSGTRSVTLTGSVANLNAYLSASAPIYTPVANSNAPVTLTMLINDYANAGAGGVLTGLNQALITITPINDAPVANPHAQTTDQNTRTSGNVLHDDQSTGTDIDGDTLSISSVATTNAEAVEPVGNLEQPIIGSNGGIFTVQADGVYSFDPNGDFDDLKVTDKPRLTSITYTLADGRGGTDTATLTITVTGTNDLPVGSDLAAVTTAEDAPVTAALPVAFDADNDALTYHAVSQPAHGSVTVNSNGTYTYTPDGDYHGTDSFTYHVNDGTGNSVPYTVTIEVTPVNDAPQGSAIPAASYQDGQTIEPFDVAVHFSDVDEGDILTYTQTGLPQGLSINPATGQIIGTLASGASQGGSNGAYTATITATDQSMRSTSQTVAISVTNPPPPAFNSIITTDENSAISGSLLSLNGVEVGVESSSPSATDMDGDTLIVTAINGSADNVNTVDASTPVSVAGTKGGSFILYADGSYHFDPGTDFDTLSATGETSTSVDFTISDGEGGSSMATLTVVLTGVNDAPVGADDRITVIEDRIHEARLPTATDVDGNSLGYAVTSQPVNGNVIINPDGTYRYTPKPDYHGTDSFTYQVKDSSTSGSVPYTVTIVVTSFNDVPVAANDSHTITIHEDAAPLPLDLLGNDSDVEGDVLKVTAIPVKVQATDDYYRQDAVPKSIETPHLQGSEQIKVDGIILDTINGMDNLGSAPPLSTSGIILSTVNGIGDLGGLSGSERTLAQQQPSLLASFTDSASPREALSGSWLASNGFGLQLQIAPVQAWLHLETGQHTSPLADIRITLADGSPLPEWIRVQSNNSVLVDRSVDSDRVDLRIDIRHTNGTVEQYAVTLDLNDAEVKVVPATAPAILAASSGITFDDQLAQASISRYATPAFQ